jgi:DNA repair protein RadD
MNEKTINKYTLATIGSIYKKPEFFAHFGIILLDECHLLNPKSLSGMFNKFINKINELRIGQSNVKVIGLTATPYRLDSMYMNYGTEFVRVASTIKLINRMKGFFWSRILYNLNIQDLIDKGFLCPLKYIDMSLVEQKDIPLNKSQSEFDLDKYEQMISGKQDKIINAINHARSISKGVLVFCSSVRQAENLSNSTEGSAVVTAKTPAKLREQIVKGFREGKLKTVFNVGVFTLGFDYPGLDCIVLLRPTRSIGLYMQMLGRGVRVAPGKQFCNVIDITSTVKNLGRIETIKLVKRDKWELESETNDNWHGTELYNYYIQKKPKVEEAKTALTSG